MVTKMFTSYGKLFKKSALVSFTGTKYFLEIIVRVSNIHIAMRLTEISGDYGHGQWDTLATSYTSRILDFSLTE